MGFLADIKQIYSLETLDTRFVVPSSAPVRSSIAEIERPDYKPTPTKDAKPSLWRTPEFAVYYLVFIVVVPIMAWIPIRISNPNHPTYPKYSHLLSDGWIPGRKIDNSDTQYSFFRDNLAYLFLLVLLHPALRRVYDLISSPTTYLQAPTSTNRPGHLTQGLSPAAAADARLQQRISFDIYFGLLFIIALHGFSAAKVLLILYMNFKIGTALPKSYVPMATWFFNVGILFANEFGRGYPFVKIATFVSPGASWGAWLDSHGGLVSRWEVLFNFTILRLISFNMDLHWSLDKSGGSPIEKKQLNPADLSERDRTSIPAKPEDYSFRNYLAYTLYAPLFLAGPIVTFNDYIAQSRHQLPSISARRILMYAVRFAVVLLAMELMIHFMYVVAIAKASPDWSAYSAGELSMLGYFHLHHIWLKLLIPWRFFRLWGLLDGIDPPENMSRCASNNYSALAFWRCWHRSYNRWVIRYIYVPIGGSRSPGLLGKVRQIANMLLVFMFVAIWHDINLRLLMWGWLVTLFFIPEIIASLVFPAKQWRDRPNQYRWLCGVGAIFNILMMMTANLVGYAIGIDGLKGLLHAMIGSTTGLLLLVVIVGSLFTGAQVMFETREEEARHGIRLKY